MRSTTADSVSLPSTYIASRCSDASGGIANRYTPSSTWLSLLWNVWSSATRAGAARGVDRERPLAGDDVGQRRALDADVAGADHVDLAARGGDPGRAVGERVLVGPDRVVTATADDAGHDQRGCRGRGEADA